MASLAWSEFRLGLRQRTLARCGRLAGLGGRHARRVPRSRCHNLSSSPPGAREASATRLLTASTAPWEPGSMSHCLPAPGSCARALPRRRCCAPWMTSDPNDLANASAPPASYRRPTGRGPAIAFSAAAVADQCAIAGMGGPRRASVSGLEEAHSGWGSRLHFARSSAWKARRCGSFRAAPRLVRNLDRARYPEEGRPCKLGAGTPPSDAAQANSLKRIGTRRETVRTPSALRSVCRRLRWGSWTSWPTGWG